MAQLTDDCFAFSGPLLRLDDMERLIRERIFPVTETERVPLHGGRGRVVAQDVSAPADLPPFDNSAVDGYAVRHADLPPDKDTTLPVSGRLTAGARANLTLKSGTAVRIFTGAAMPKGADTVFMQEDVTVEGDQVTVPKGLKVGANRRLAGEDVAAGAVVLPSGTVLEAQHIALAAALGLTEIMVRRRLKVAIFSTGNEVIEPGSVRAGAAIYDSNRVLLTELLERLGAVVTDLGILADEPEKLSRRLAEAAADHDLIVTSGGVSTGRPTTCEMRSTHWQSRVLAGRHQAGASGGAWSDPGDIRTRRSIRRVARQPGRGLRHIRAYRETAVATAIGRARTDLSHCRFVLHSRTKKEGPSRIRPCGTQARARWRNRSGQAPAGRCGHSHIVDGDRRIAGVPRGCDDD